MLITEFYNFYKTNGLSIEVINQFRRIIYNFYKQHGRNFPFRKSITPYTVLVSEIMLQQTQTERVSGKFQRFIQKYPDFLSLSKASIEDVLKVWQGLGYNRRGIALKKIADIVINDYKGKLPDSVEILKTFPQIGPNTASSIVAFAFNKPTFFIETNIRRVYIYFFFPGKSKVNDKEIAPIVKATLDKTNPRNWYYALMDYGVMLKKKYPDLNKRSAHYRKQAPFKGSNRQIRGKLLKMLIKNKVLKISEIERKLKDIDRKRLINILDQLEKEGFVTRNGNVVEIAN